jgi:hypothetical protein
VHPPQEAIAEYHRLVAARAAATETVAHHDSGDRPSIQAVAMFGTGSEPTHLLSRGEEATLTVTAANPRRMPLNVGASIYRSDGVQVFGTNTFITETRLPPDAQLVVEVHFPELGLQKGSYYLQVGLFGEKVATLYEMRDHAYEFQVDQRDDYQGLVFLPHSWRVRARR